MQFSRKCGVVMQFSGKRFYLPHLPPLSIHVIFPSVSLNFTKSIMSSVLQFLENKSILVTGATGFLAKVFIEKILRVQPKIKKLYLLLRAADSDSALHRFTTEVMAKELFKLIKEKYASNLSSFIEEKICVVPGDITLENLGVEDTILQQMLSHVEVVVNLAATTDFDERYDVSFAINTIGPLHVLDFSKRCTYVCGEKEGIVLETPFHLGDTLNGVCGLDIQTERKIIDEKLQELQSQHEVAPKYISSTMKNLGIQRARKYGWPNTYAFTKAMGEMLLENFKDKIPIVTIRPTIITSTYKEPFPGWLEGIRNIDSFIVGYGKGKMTWLPGDPQGVVDLIPVDMVVNAMIVAMVAHVDQPTGAIYHVGSSATNPVLYSSLQAYGLRYFTERPWINNHGEPVIVSKATQLSTVSAVQRYMQIRYLIPIKILNLVNIATCKYFEETYIDLSRKVKFMMRLVQLFTPYVFFKGVFDDINTENLRTAAQGNKIENEIFYFDPKSINWEEYFMYTHIAGVVKYGVYRRVV